MINTILGIGLAMVAISTGVIMSAFAALVVGFAYSIIKDLLTK